ncbi:AMP-binding acetyl-CoA synthetase [Hydrogenophaga sp. Root209]|uniref:AMP-binding protein n=1 Tax=Hydrogenophaga sp. Root209 TaxID=1736490 RepID=UPI0006F97FFA|nr:AMP-binding protein [Hydrogenophaga sp. Root209]KRB96860.1 AMP-binding acetyl-CoA synthetase [Hydrogenophaga sp. Root209]
MAKLMLEYAFEHERLRRDEPFLTQPVGNGEVVNWTWGETMDQARRMAAHLRTLGLEPGARVAMLAKNSAHFFMAELAIWMAGGTTVAIFPTESSHNIHYVLEHCEPRLLFVGKLDDWPKQAGGVPTALPCIALPLAPDTDFEQWDDIVARTPPLAGEPMRAADELAMLLYTSGSTGQPKGVMQTFGSVSAASECIVEEMRHRFTGDIELRVLSYLPLAHCFERAWVECQAFVRGDMQVYFTDTAATFMKDLQRARPTLFISVPRLWTKFQQGVLASMPAAQLDALLDNPATAAAVGAKVLASLGLDQVKNAGSGSAPLPAELLVWYRRLGLNLFEGYGMTEDFAYSHGGDGEASLPGHVGKPYPGVQARLADDGEILVKSPGCMAGYYKQPELNAEAFTDDGFFRTGDLGVVNEAGLLRITGRKKELFKTAKGKYIAPVPIENLLNAHPMVELALVSGVGQATPYAALLLDEALRPRLTDAAVRDQVQAALTELLNQVNARLGSHEQLQFLAVAREPWSIENGCLTPTMKIKRSRIEASMAPHLPQWYEQPQAVIWA